MTRLWNDPSSFTEDALVGFLDANAQYVVGVPGGVVRASATRPGKVAVIVGGGSGHYPAFCGVVGPGFADGAVVGNVFTSPSAAEAASVGRAANGGAGVLFSTGNYAGDVMNFGQAVERLATEGIDARYVLVTDDVASAPATERAKRRGIAGDFPGFKTASAAAEEGMDLDAVERVARHANDRTRTLAAALDGRTMPGATEPLFGGQRERPPGSSGRGVDRLPGARGLRAVVRGAAGAVGAGVGQLGWPRDGGRAAAQGRGPGPCPGRRTPRRRAREQRHPRRRDPQWARTHQVRGAVHRLGDGCPAAARSRSGDRRAGGRGAGDQPRHGRVLADPDVARRRA